MSQGTNEPVTELPAPQGAGSAAAEEAWPRGEGISPTLQWLFEGAGYAYVTLTVDALLLLAALVIADAINPEPPSVLVLLASPLAVALMASRRLYDPTAQIARLDRIGSIIGATAVAAIAIAGVVQLTKPAATDADLIALQLVLAALMLIVWRMGWSFARIHARRTGRSGRRTIIVGAGEVGARLERRLDDLRQIGLVPVGFVDADPVPTLELRERRAPVLGAPDDFDAIVDATGAEHAIFAFQIEPDVTLRGLIRRCRERGLGIAIVPRLFDDATNRMVLEHVGGIPVFELRQVDPKGWEFSVKHGIDRVTAAVMLLLLSPLYAAVAIAVYASLGSPVLFRQRRVGRDGQAFDLLKFRSMRPAADGEAPRSRGGDAGARRRRGRGSPHSGGPLHPALARRRASAARQRPPWRDEPHRPASGASRARGDLRGTREALWRAPPGPLGHHGLGPGKRPGPGNVARRPRRARQLVHPELVVLARLQDRADDRSGRVPEDRVRRIA